MSPIVFTVLVVFALSLAASRVGARTPRLALLLAASYAFYFSWVGAFVVVLMASSLVNYAIGAVLRRDPRASWLWLGVLINLLLLFTLKYFPGSLGAGIIAPVGLSFWTFQGLSYLFDTYREEDIDPTPLEFCLFMAFWPTVLSGPVCRLPHMLAQFREARAVSRADVSAGALLILQGVVMKLVLAQLLASGLHPGAGVNAGFDDIAGGWGALDVWLLGAGFGFLLYFDFAGYSNLVIGSARLFGFELPQNFDRPFLAPTPSVFWTRWHMSLSSWIRDYVFVPLATAWRLPLWPYAALVIAMTLFGLWHAATVSFICWGLYHGLLLVAHRAGQHVVRRMPRGVPPPLGGVLATAATFSLVSIGWVFFRASDAAVAWSMLQTLFAPAAYLRMVLSPSYVVLILSIIVAYFAYGAVRAWLESVAASAVVLTEKPRGPEARPCVVHVSGVSTGAVSLLNWSRSTLWYWLGPTVFIVSSLAGIAMYERHAVPMTSPFIYTLF
jgi:D-alanyl-lipoteichoic acid acyltransferase DltB (MBOAT superfamily)